MNSETYYLLQSVTGKVKAKPAAKPKTAKTPAKKAVAAKPATGSSRRKVTEIFEQWIPVN
jgi:hypothetical protein